MKQAFNMTLQKMQRGGRSMARSAAQSICYLQIARQATGLQMLRLRHYFLAVFFFAAFLAVFFTAFFFVLAFAVFFAEHPQVLHMPQSSLPYDPATKLTHVPQGHTTVRNITSLFSSCQMVLHENLSSTAGQPDRPARFKTQMFLALPDHSSAMIRCSTT